MTTPETSLRAEAEAEREARQRQRATAHVQSVVSQLTPMQRTFTIEYLVTSNATAAARTAGYASPEKQGSRLLTYPKIQAAISDYFFGPEMDAREVIQRLGQQARAEWTEYLRPDGTIDVDQMEADGRKYLVNGVRPSKEGPVYEFPDQQKALVDIGRYHKLFTDGVDVTSGEKPVPFADIVAAMQRARKAGVDE